MTMNVYIQENFHIGAESAQISSEHHHVILDTSVFITYNEYPKSRNIVFCMGQNAFLLFGLMSCKIKPRKSVCVSV